jgi:putative phosphoribosyl transferase
VFADRRDAGRRLASSLTGLATARPVVVALPRGGVPVGFEVARALAAPLDVLVVRKLGAPGNPELAVGAIAEGGGVVFDAASAGRTGMTQAALDATVKSEAAELRRRVERYRGGVAALDLRGRTAIMVDDGLATGLTALAAVRALRAAGAARVVVAVPLGARESVALIGGEADEVICHTIPQPLEAVGRHYRDFSAVSDEDVVELLSLSRRPGCAGG